MLPLFSVEYVQCCPCVSVCQQSECHCGVVAGVGFDKSHINGDQDNGIISWLLDHTLARREEGEEGRRGGNVFCCCCSLQNV